MFLYGSHLCTLFNREAEDLYIAWTKAQQRV